MRTHSRLLPVVVAVAALAAPACGERSLPVQEIELVDYTPPAMFRDLAMGLKVPFVMELVVPEQHERSDLRMKGTDARTVLAEITRRDPRYQAELRDGVMLYWPTGEAEAKSRWSKVVPAFEGSGGVLAVTRDLMVQTGVEHVIVESRRAGQNRPVSVKVKDATYRDIFALMAAQAHVGFDVDDAFVRIAVVP